MWRFCKADAKYVRRGPSNMFDFHGGSRNQPFTKVGWPASTRHLCRLNRDIKHKCQTSEFARPGAAPVAGDISTKTSYCCLNATEVSHELPARHAATARKQAELRDLRRAGCRLRGVHLAVLRLTAFDASGVFSRTRGTRIRYAARLHGGEWQ